MLPWLLNRLLALKHLAPGVLTLVLCGCSLFHPQFTRPAVSVVSIQLRQGNFLQQSFAVKLHVQNPNDRALPVRGLHIELNVGGDEVASGVSDRAFVVAPFGETDFDMTIKSNLALVMLKLADKLNQQAQSIDYDLTGAASIDLPFFGNLPFHQSGTLSLSGG